MGNVNVNIPRDVARKLGFYVYAYVNPLDQRIFYVGKGKGQRALAHLQDTAKSNKVATIRQIRAAGRAPDIQIIAHKLANEETALRIEAAVIDALGLPALTNQVRGWKALEFGRTPLAEIVAHYRRRPVNVREPAVLIRINKLYRPGMTAGDLYDATRGVWKIGHKRAEAKLAFAVFDGIVREVYEITEWLPAGSTFSSRYPRGEALRGRWEFVGRLADEKIRRRYVDRDVSHVFAQGAQNPIRYVNVTPRSGRTGRRQAL
jgi:hypothetical protein